MDGRLNPRGQKQGQGGPQSPAFNWNLILWIFILFFLIGPWISRQLTSKGTEISYSAFRGQLEAGNVEKVTVQGEKISGEFKRSVETKNVEGKPVPYKDFLTYLPSFGDNTLLPMLEAQKVDIVTQPRKDVSFWGEILVGILPFLILIGVGIFFLRKRGFGGAQNIFSFAGSRARLYERRKERTTFNDVAGARGAKIELQEIIEFLKDPARIQRLGGKAPKGVLLVGPPGTGKTLLARAVAGEAEVPFLSITGSDFMEMFVGVGASRVRSMFNDAKRMAPAIIFIDEIDSIGRKRGAGIGGGQDEREQTLNQLLSELDGFEANENVIVMAATNRPDVLDSALLRPGRFDRRITVDLPSLKDRVEILKIHARNKSLSDGLNLEEVARGTPGFSGADLENLLNEAAILAARKNKDKIEQKDVDEAVDKILMGLERENIAITSEERRLLAYHEGGHAVVAALLPNADPVHKVTIVPRGQAMGVTQQLPEREKYIYPKEYMIDRLAVMMGGRAAEEVVAGTATSGAADDLKQATGLARRMVLEWGMSQSLGQMAIGDGRENVFLGYEIAQRREYSEETAREVDEEIKKILKESYDRAVDLLQKHRDGLDRVAKDLLEKEEITGKEVLELVGVEKTPASVEASAPKSTA
ncbi:MAG TPA: ATP-dependent zinc metalloprotease FtsH [Thermodesulfobacteriota bacterium]|nr:ATP-dependent zinc metalloprotease FtsH [Thermodesulfobacteriota bacterium]